ncbi:AAA family ATPase [Stenotrophomonas maltophilia]
MQLKSFRVRKFRNIVDSGDVAVSDSVTCLVGKNEAGKSGLLEALYLLSPAYKDTPDAEKQYPRWLHVKDRRTSNIAEFEFITATFVLDTSDVQAVGEKLGAAVSAGQAIEVMRNYGGTTLWSMEVDDLAIAFHFQKLLPTEIQKLIGQVDSMTTFVTSLIDLEATEENGLSIEDVKEAKQLLKKHSLTDNNGIDHVIPILEKRLPTFFRFTGYNTLPGRIDLRELATAAEEPGNSAMQTARALVALAGTTPKQLSADDYEQRRSEMEAVSIDLTNQVFEYWKQNPDLEVNIDVDKEEVQRHDGVHIAARYLEIRLRDKRTGYSNNFSQRSSGFQWFFSFLAAFSEFENKEATIVLLDEPALALHGRAQADFLRFINERLAIVSPVIYTTHSPFMVEMGHLDRVRIIEDRGPPNGSVVSEDALANDPDSLFPLQAALGYDIAQSLFIGPNNLVVEGTSDFIYLTVMSQVASQKKKTALDSRWRILPSGGATNIPTFVGLVGPHLDITVLADSDTQGMQRVTGMIEKKLITGTRLILANAVTGQKNSDIEDLFSVEDYVSLYNDTFKAKLKPADLGPGDRVVKRIEAKIGKTYDHGEVAETLLRNHQGRTFSDETVDSFSKLNELVNATMKT